MTLGFFVGEILGVEGGRWTPPTLPLVHIL